MRPATLERDELSAYRRHVVDRVRSTVVQTAPFYYLAIDDVLPPAQYDALLKRMLEYKHGGQLQARPQDSAGFVNQRYNLVTSRDPEPRALHAVFSDPEVKRALLEKFYLDPGEPLARALQIHDEFEFVYTAGGRTQDIHVDIPPKFMSFVFYLPEAEPTEAQSKVNATLLYDKSLAPHYGPRYKSNSLCVFVPHFYSYHGFASTIDRTALVMFYVNRSEHAKWRRALQADEAPFDKLKDAIASKLARHPLIEYGADAARISAERAACLVNAPRGRVKRPASG